MLNANLFLDESMCEIMDCLPEMQPSVSLDSKMGLVYIAGYIVGKDENGDDADDSHFYYDKYGSFTDNLNRGGLHLSGDTVCQWVVYGYIMFNEVVNHCVEFSPTFLICMTSNLKTLIYQDLPTYFSTIIAVCFLRKSPKNLDKKF